MDWRRLRRNFFERVTEGEHGRREAVDVVAALLAAGADVDAKDSRGETPLMMTIRRPNEEVMRALLEAGADVRAKSECGGQTALHLAGCAESVRALVAAGADLEVTDIRGDTPLLVPAVLAKHAVVRALVEAGADVGARTARQRHTALHVAGCAENVRALVAAGADMDAIDAGGAAPLMRAARRSNDEVLRALLEAGADVGAKVRFAGSTALHEARCAENVRALVAAGADVEAKEFRGYTPLLLALKRGNPAVVLALVEAGADLGRVTRTERTALHLIVCKWRHGCAEVVRAMLAAGADVEAMDSFGRRPLVAAVIEGSVEAVSALVAAGADVGAPGTLPYGTACSAALHCATELGHHVIVRVLLSAGAPVDQRDCNGRTPLHYAAAYRRLPTIKELADAGANLEAKDNYGATPLHRAATAHKADWVDLLHTLGVDLHSVDNNGWTALHYAASAGAGMVAVRLVELGLSTHAQATDGKTPLHIAAAKAQVGITKVLLWELKAPVNVRDRKGRTALHVAARALDREVLEVVLLAGADRTARDADGNTPADLATAPEAQRLLRRWALSA